MYHSKNIQIRKKDKVVKDSLCFSVHWNKKYLVSLITLYKSTVLLREKIDNFINLLKLRARRSCAR